MSTPSPLTIGIVGLNFGRHVITQLRQKPASDFFTIGAVCDLQTDKAAHFAEQLQVKAYTDLDTLLADPDIAVIGLFTSPIHRAQLLQKIIRAGKDVMTTKPFELDPVAARAVLEEAIARKRVVHLNSPSPLAPGWIQQVMAWREKYDLGRPISCHAEATVSYREKPDGSWYDRPEFCPVAPILRLGIYLINDAVRLFGDVAQVQATSSRVFTGRPTADNAQLNLVFKNQALGSIHATFCVDDGQFYANSFILHYERGTIHRNLRFIGSGRADQTSRLHLVTQSGEELLFDEHEITDIEQGYQWNVLYDSITRRKITPMPIEAIVHGVEILAAMKRAESSHQTERV